MADYAKKTNAELQEILKSRNLPTSGKKADLVARLNESDQQAAEPRAEPEPEPVPAAEPAQPEPTETTSTEQPTDPTSTTAEPEPEPTDKPSPDTALATQTNYSLNLPTSTLDTELAKRKARAERFGTSSSAQPTTTDTSEPTTTQSAEAEPSAEALKNLERAKRFGTGQTAINKLDEALPSEQQARGSRKRTHAAVGTDLDDPGLKRSFANRGRGRGGRGAPPPSRGRGAPTAGRGAAGAKPQGVQKAPAYTSEKDKLAAEARKKKFATA